MAKWRTIGPGLPVIGLFIALTFADTAPVRADILRDSEKSISYCFRLDGTEAYPDYIFMAYFSQATGGSATIESGRCIGYYKFSKPVLLAMQRAEFAANPPPSGGNREAEKAYFTTNPAFARSELTITRVNTVDKSNPLEGIVDTYRVASSDGQTLTVVPVSVQYAFTQGRSETIPWSDGERPAPTITDDNLLAGRPWYVALMPALACGAVAAIGLRHWRTPNRKTPA